MLNVLHCYLNVNANSQMHVSAQARPGALDLMLLSMRCISTSFREAQAAAQAEHVAVQHSSPAQDISLLRPSMQNYWLHCRWEVVKACLTVSQAAPPPQAGSPGCLL